MHEKQQETIQEIMQETQEKLFKKYIKKEQKTWLESMQWKKGTMVNRAGIKSNKELGKKYVKEVVRNLSTKYAKVPRNCETNHAKNVEVN